MQKAKKGKNTGKAIRIKQKTKNIIREFGKRLMVAALVVATGGSVSGCGNSYDEKPKEKKEVICSTEIGELNQSRIKSMKLDDNVEGREYFVQKVEKEVCTDGENEWVESEKHSFEPPIIDNTDNLTDIKFEFMGGERSISNIFINEKEEITLQITDVRSKQFLEEGKAETFATAKKRGKIKVVGIEETGITVEVAIYDLKNDVDELYDDIKTEKWFLAKGTILIIKGIHILLYDIGEIRDSKGNLEVAWIGFADEAFYLQDTQKTEIEFNREKFHVSTTIDADIKEDGRIIINGIEIKRIEIEN